MGGVEGLKVGMEAIGEVVEERIELRVGRRMIHQDELVGERFDAAQRGIEMGVVVKLPVEVRLEWPEGEHSGRER